MSLSTIEQLVRFDITIEIYDVDRMNDLSGVVRFIPIQRCSTNAINEELLIGGIHEESDGDGEGTDVLSE